MQFGTGSNAERHKNTEGQSTKMTYVRPYIKINKPSPIFDCVTPVSVSLATLARQLENARVALVGRGERAKFWNRARV